LAQNELPLRQKARSHTKVATKKAIGNGTSIGWIGCPAILAVLLGFGMIASQVRGHETNQQNLFRVPAGPACN
jgi:hypothetical protein